MSERLTLSLLVERFAVVRLPADSIFPAWVNHTEATFWSITHTPDEWSIVCDQDTVPPACDTVEPGWRAFKLHGPIGLSVTGVIAGITAALSAAGIPVFVQSTYDTDYVLVKDENVDHAMEVLGARHVVRGGS